MAPPTAEEWDLLDPKKPPSAASINPFSDRIQMKPIGGMKFMSKLQSELSQPQAPPPQSNPIKPDVIATQPNTEQNMSSSQKSRTRELQEQVTFLVEKVQQLSNELQTTRQAHQLSSDQYRAEITMLQSELKNQRMRHEEIVSSLRTRLVESELARDKIQEQLMHVVQEESKKEKAVNARWDEMAMKVNEDARWVEEQMSCWKDSLDEHERRMDAAKVRGELNAELPQGGVADLRGSEVVSEESSAAERRRQQRTSLGLDEDFGDD